MGRVIMTTEEQRQALEYKALYELHEKLAQQVADIPVEASEE